MKQYFLMLTALMFTASILYASPVLAEKKQRKAPSVQIPTSRADIMQDERIQEIMDSIESSGGKIPDRNTLNPTQRQSEDTQNSNKCGWNDKNLRKCTE